MRRLLGMPNNRALSDEEFVQRVRKNLDRSAKLRLFFLLTGGVLLVSMCLFVYMLTGYIQTLEPGVQSLMWFGLLGGTLMGFALGGLFQAAMFNVAMGFDLYGFARPSRLMIEYRDLLKQIVLEQTESGQLDISEPEEAGHTAES